MKTLSDDSAERLWKMFFPQFPKPHGMALVRELYELNQKGK